MIFLVGLFDDFHWPECESLPGFAAGVRQLAYRLSAWPPASTLGAARAYLWLDRRRRPAGDAERRWLARLHDELKAAV